jgi:hypothetical protein
MTTCIAIFMPVCLPERPFCPMYVLNAMYICTLMYRRCILASTFISNSSILSTNVRYIRSPIRERRLALPIVVPHIHFISRSDKSNILYVRRTEVFTRIVSLYTLIDHTAVVTCGILHIYAWLLLLLLSHKVVTF